MGMQPTNAGINFQQRVSALFMVNMIFDVRINNILSISNDEYIESIHLEGNDEIDDMICSTKAGNKLYFQMKRTVNLSKKKESDFVKALRQFVMKHIKSENDKDVFVLATSSASSRSVIENLRKILESIRLDNDAMNKVPLTAKEQDVYESYHNIIKDLFYELTNKEITDVEFSNISKKIRIEVFDIENGMILEKSILSLVDTKINTDPYAFWSILIQKALEIASNRQSVSQSALKEQMNLYIKNNEDHSIEDKDENIFKYIINDDFLIDRDFVLGTSSDLDKLQEEGDIEANINTYYIIELCRFSDNGEKKYKYSEDGRLILTNGVEINVLFRASTMKRLKELMEKDERFIDSNILCIPATVNNSNDNTYCSAYSKLALNNLEEKENELKYCIHCGKVISTNDAYLVESDIDLSKVEFGLVHENCLENVDRVMGTIRCDMFGNKYYLKNFDYEVWIKCIRDSQCVLSQIKTINYQMVSVGWNPYYDNNTAANYCCKMNLEDGNFVITTSRGKVDRENKSSMKKTVKDYNEYIEKGKKANNPVSYTSKNFMFGKYNDLMKMKEKDEGIIECVNAESIKYTPTIGTMYNKLKNYYAPLVLIIVDEEVFEIDGAIVVLTNPLELKNYIINWKNINVNLEDMEYELLILENDYEFDRKMSKWDNDGKIVIVDPMFDKNKEIIQGAMITNIYKLR